MQIRVRFAPSPTGNIHIGNIRTAIFNWLFTRHENGKFLLRIEDTDLERSTKEACDSLIECLKWLNIDWDEDIFFQTSAQKHHLEQAVNMVNKGLAYSLPSPEENKPTILNIPYHCDELPFVREVGKVDLEVHPEEPVTIDFSSVNYAAVSKKGKPVKDSASLAGFKDMQVFDENNNCIFELNKVLDEVLNNHKAFSFEKCRKITFTRREVFFEDLIKGELAKPLDSMKDLIIVRSDGSPVFHLANVCDDVSQQITHIIRGDDHVENTYRHLFLYNALDALPPRYAHLPMIVNNQGKPYSKRDGDAYVGDFREKGFLPEVLFNYLTLLGWSPGDDREKLTRQELIDLFTLVRIKSHPAQFDHNKLLNLNSQYLAEMDPADFAEITYSAVKKCDWFADITIDQWSKVANLMQIRTKSVNQVCSWKYFFTETLEYNDYDQKAVKKFLKKDEIRKGLKSVIDEFAPLPEFNENNIENAIRQAEKTAGLLEGKLNPALRIGVTGCTFGAEINETLIIIDKERTIARLKKVLSFEI